MPSSTTLVSSRSCIVSRTSTVLLRRQLWWCGDGNVRLDSVESSPERRGRARSLRAPAPAAAVAAALAAALARVISNAGGDSEQGRPLGRRWLPMGLGSSAGVVVDVAREETLARV